jgi:hypothetical protein
MRAKRNRFAAPLLHVTDRHGRTIESSILSVAQEIAPRALIFGEKLLGDSALAATLLEEAAASVSETLRRKMERDEPRIEDATRYLFRAYIRRIQVEKQTQLVLDFGAEDGSERHAHPFDRADPERQLLVQELLVVGVISLAVELRVGQHQANGRSLGSRCDDGRQIPTIVPGPASRALRQQKLLIQIRHDHPLQPVPPRQRFCP